MPRPLPSAPASGGGGELSRGWRAGCCLCHLAGAPGVEGPDITGYHREAQCFGRDIHCPSPAGAPCRFVCRASGGAGASQLGVWLRQWELALSVLSEAQSRSQELGAHLIGRATTKGAAGVPAGLEVGQLPMLMISVHADACTRCARDLDQTRADSVRAVSSTTPATGGGWGGLRVPWTRANSSLGMVPDDAEGTLNKGHRCWAPRQALWATTRRSARARRERVGSAPSP